jgi:hypothetical protein
MDATLATSRAPRPIPRNWIEVDREREAITLILEPHVAVHKSPVLLNPIQDSLDLHPAVPSGHGVCRNRHSLRVDAGCVSRGTARVEAASYAVFDSCVFAPAL